MVPNIKLCVKTFSNDKNFYSSLSYLKGPYYILFPTGYILSGILLIFEIITSKNRATILKDEITSALYSNFE